MRSISENKIFHEMIENVNLQSDKVYVEEKSGE